MGLRQAVAAARNSRPLPGPGCPAAAARLALSPRQHCDGLAGSVAPQCDIEGSAPNITLNLNLPTNGPPLQDTVVHHFVTSIDGAMLMSSSAKPLDDSVYNGPYKFPFILPSDSFGLCYYTSQVPNRAIKVQRCVITNWICPRRRAYWFGSLLYFRIPDFTLTGCYVDQHPVQIFVPGKPKTSASWERLSSRYYIWNSRALAPKFFYTIDLINFLVNDFLHLNKADS